MSSILNPTNTGSTLQVTDFSFSSLGYTDASFAAMENAVLLNIAQGKIATEVTSLEFNSNTYNGAQLNTNYSSPNSFGKNIMINNTIIDTPNLALIATPADLSFTVTDFSNIIIGSNSFKTTPITFKGFVRDLSSSNAWIAEDLSLNFTDNTDTQHDASNKWNVDFDNTIPSYNRISRAVNSYLNSRTDNSGAINYPMTVQEDTVFNTTYAMGALDGSAAFTKYYTQSNNTISPIAVDFSRNNMDPIAKVSIYEISYNQVNNVYDFGSEYGMFRIEKFAADIDVNSTWTNNSDVSANLPEIQLPFGLSNNGDTPVPLDSSYSLVTDLNYLFPQMSTADILTFIVTATDNNGGYYATDDTQIQRDVANQEIYSLNSDNLINNPAYMQNNYQNMPHLIDFSNGQLTVIDNVNSNGSNKADFNFGLDASNNPLLNTYLTSETLGSTQYNQNGSILLEVQDVLSRTKDLTYSGTADISNIFVSYGQTGEGWTGPSNTILTNGISDIVKNTSEISFEVTQVLGGYRSDLSYGYHYSTVNSYDIEPSFNSTMYTGHVLENPVTLTASNLSGDFIYIRVAGDQNLTEGITYIRGLATDGSGQGIPSDASNNTVIGEIDFIDPTVIVENISLDVSNIAYRTMLKPKTLEYLQAYDGLALTNGWSFVTGFEENDGKFIAANPSDPYVYTAYENIFTSSNGFISDGTGGIDTSNLYSTGLGDSHNINVVISKKPASGANVIFTVDPTDILGVDGIQGAPNSFVFAPVQTDVSGSLTRYVVQCPIGHYTNVYLKTPYFDASSSSVLSFSTAAVMSLLWKYSGITLS